MSAALACLGALAQEARLQVFRLLVRAGPEGLPAGEIAAALDCPPQTLSFHLRQLSAAGLVAGSRTGRSIVYRLRPERAREVLSFLAEDCCQGRRELCAPLGASPRTRSGTGGAHAGPRSVIFVCARNSARSVMAEAFLRREAGERFVVRSAGLRPAPVHPLTIRVMGELGIDLSSHGAQDLGSVVGAPVHDVAVLVCDQAQRECRGIRPFARERLYWPFEDPVRHAGTEAERVAKFREVRDAIRERIRAWLAAQAGAGEKLCAS